jgi:translation initiation factor IF-1
MVDEGKLEMEGVVISSSHGMFLVKADNGITVLCSLSGKIRQNSVRILPGDRIRLEASAYDPSKGRIVFRMKT